MERRIISISNHIRYFNDLTVIVNEKHEFHTSSFALVRHSGFFAAMAAKVLPKPRKHPELHTFKVGYTDVKSIKYIIDFITKITTSDNQLSDADMMELLNIGQLKKRLLLAHQFNVPCLLDCIASSAIHNLTVDNCLDIMEIADDPKSDCDLLKYVVNDYVIRNFYKVVKLPKFAHLVRYEKLCSLLEDINVNVFDEAQFFEIICAWVGFDRKTRLQYFVPLMKAHVLTYRVSAEFVNCVYTSELGVAAKIRTTVNEEFYKSNKSQFARRPQEAIFQVGGFKLDRATNKLKASSAVEIYDPFLNSWTTHTQGTIALDTGLVRSACVELDNVVYVIGGISVPAGLEENRGIVSSRVQAFDLRKRCWEDRAPLPTARYFLGCCVCNGRIYAVGGCDKTKEDVNSLEIFIPEKNTWIIGPAMFRRQSELGVVSLKGKVYAYGGKDVSQGTLNMYNPELKKWTVVNAQQKCRGGPTLLTYNDYFLVICGYGEEFDGRYRKHSFQMEILWLNIDGSTKKEVTCWPRPRGSNFAGTLMHENAYLLGGRTGYHWVPNMRDMEFAVLFYNPVTGLLRYPAKTHHTEGSCCTIHNWDLIRPLLPENAHRDPST